MRAVWSPANRGSGQSLRQLPSGTASFCILNRTFDLSAARMYVHKCFFRLRKVEMRIMIKLEKIKLPFIISDKNYLPIHPILRMYNI